MKEYNIGTVTILVRADNIVELTHNEDSTAPNTIATAKKNMEMMKQIVGDRRIGFLVNVTKTYTNKEVLDYYHDVDLGEVARALVITSFATKVIGNMYMKLTKKRDNENGRYVPNKLFTEKEKGMQWLREELKKSEVQKG